MRFRAAWFGIALLALVAGGLFGAVAPPQATAPAFSVHVPNGRIGDVATYRLEENGYQTDRGHGAAVHDITVHLAGVEEILDQYGSVRKVLRVHIAGFVEPTRTHQRTEYVDLATRDTVRIDADIQLADGNMGSYVWFGPSYQHLPDPYEGLFRYTHANQTWTRYQDRTFTYGDELSTQRAAQLISDVADRGTPRRSTATSHVDRLGERAGERVLGITETWEVVEPAWRDSRYNGTTEVWLSAEHPFPLVVRPLWRAETDEWLEHQNRTYALLGVERGEGAEIPWGRGDAPDPPVVERSQGGLWRPEDGVGSRFPIGIDNAAAWAVGDVTLTGFQAWRLANPGWQVAGFDLRAGARLGFNDIPGYLVELTFAAPGGDTAYRVRSTYGDAAGPPRNDNGRSFSLVSDKADFRLPAASPDVAPSTLAQVDRLWRAVGRPDMTEQGPDRIVWGATFAECAQEDGGVAACSSVSVEYAMGWMHYGRARGMYGLPEANVNGFHSDLIDVDLVEPRLISGTQERGDWSIQPPLLADEPAAVAPAAAPRPVAVVPLAGAALAATAAFALLATLYAYHLVKFGLTHAVMMSGFTRLTEPEVLAHATRASILEAIRADPGLSASQIARLMDGLAWSTVVYHLGILRQHGLVDSVVDGRHRRFFPQDSGPEARHPTVTLKNERTRAVYALVGAGDGVHRGELARAVGISVPGVLWHLDRLIRAGLIEPVRVGRRVEYRIAGPDGPH